MEYLDCKEEWERFLKDSASTNTDYEFQKSVQDRADYYFIEHPELVEKYAPNDGWVKEQMKSYVQMRKDGFSVESLKSKK